MVCQNQEKNLSNCNCTYDPCLSGRQACPRKGICCECLAYHRENKELPACYFPEDIEKTFNRSITNFFKNKR